MKKPIEKSLLPADFAFTHEHYVAIFKSKQGELCALEGLGEGLKEHLTPLIELHEPTEKPLYSHFESLSSSISKAWCKRTFFVDTKLLTASAATTKVAYGELTKAGLSFVPVVALSCSKGIMDAIVPFAQGELLLRLHPQDFAYPPLLQARMDTIRQTFGLEPEDVHVLIDYGKVQSSVIMETTARHDLSALPNLLSWKTVTIAGGSFPLSLAAHPPLVWHSTNRHEWIAWRAIRTAPGSLKRVPTFGDYGVRDSGPPAAFGSPYPNLRYTSADVFLFQRHNVLVKDGGSEGIHPICASLLDMPEFRGPTFSQGDCKIAAAAPDGSRPGNATSWSEWGMSHHFATVVNEILTPLAA